MDCIILAGGLGTRLRPAVPHLPKGLAPIRGVPFLHLLVRELSRYGAVSKIVLAVGYLADAIVESFAKTSFAVTFSREETPLGTGGAIRQALERVKTDQVWVFNGDTYCPVLLDQMAAFHYEKRADLTMACQRLDDASRFGTLELSGEGRIKGFKEKQSGAGVVNCGVYLLRKSMFNHLPFESSFSLEQQGFPHFLQMHRLFGFSTEEPFIDIGTPESYSQSQELLRSMV